ncbi:hypothetical protein QFZ61_002737 [Arthrobacter sp. B3I4]|nr:hypothetical protein [Arthrobacter sp. B3I4]
MWDGDFWEEPVIGPYREISYIESPTFGNHFIRGGALLK